MAQIRAFSAFDMRIVIPSSARVVVADDAITVIGGTRGTTVTGDIQSDANGVTGTVTAFGQTLGNVTVFTATGVSRSAATVADILADRDNDAFLAYTLSGNDRIGGSAGKDYLIGFGGNDTLSGGDNHDSLFGGAGTDTLDGGDGNDYLAGGTGGDLMRGSTGNDVYLVDDAGDTVTEVAGGGTDTILSYVSRTLPAFVESLVLLGNSALNGRGGAGADVLDGNEGANWLRGEAGDDRIGGDGGADVLEGGLGRDSLTGGAGDDVFRFRTAAEANTDRIFDFAHGIDTMDLSRIDADSTVAGNQAFHFIGEANFGGHAGELSAYGSWVRGDVNGDGVADFTIVLVRDPVVSATDFIL